MSQQPPFWGLSFSLHPDAKILVIDDNPARATTFKPLLENRDVTWVLSLEELDETLRSHGPFDVYFLDYDLGDDKGGWWPAAGMIRNADPLSIAKVVFVHSSNPDAARYRTIFPVAIIIQWNAFATMLGTPSVTYEVVELILSRAGNNATLDELQAAASDIQLRSD